MGDIFIMSGKQLKRKVIFEAIREKKLTLKEASQKINLCSKQTGIAYKRYLREGDAGLMHKNLGKRPGNAIDMAYRQQVLDTYKAKYMGFGATFASEKLLEDDGFKVHRETLRLWLLEENLIVKTRKRKSYRKKRARKEKFGEMLQIDGSIHNWFSDDRKNSCLLNIVDDATNTTLAMLDTGETTKVLLSALKKWIQLYGVPNSVYVDLKSVYISPVGLRTINPDEKANFSVFEQVCEKLGIDIIKAYSAQAKGRVERSHRIFQDRLVKEIKLYKLTTIGQVNKHLEEVFLPNINAKFTQQPKSTIDMHRDAAVYGDLDEILCWEYKRTLENNWTIRLNNEYYQIKQSATGIVKPQDRVLVKKYLNNQIKIWFNNSQLSYKKLPGKVPAMSKTKKYYKPKKKAIACDAVQKPNIFKPLVKYIPKWFKAKSERRIRA